MIYQNRQWEKDCLAAQADLARLMPSLHAAKQKSEHWRDWYEYKLIELDRFCYTHQPRVILELGSGWTTRILTRYSTEFSARLVTVEQSEEWRKETEARGGGQEWFMSPAVASGDRIRYANLPQLERIDLLYVDGPASSRGDREYTCEDAVLLAKSTDVRHVLFDIRSESAQLFLNECGDRYHYEAGGTMPWTQPVYLRPRRHHSWFYKR